MKKILTLVLLVPSAALAHAGDHSSSFAQNIAHALTEPDHVAIALGVLALGYAAYRYVRG